MDPRKATQVTQEGHDRLTAELRELTDVRRPELVSAVAEARSHGDLRENAAYDAARQDQAMNERRISELEGMLQNVVIVDTSVENASGIIRIGSRVTVDFGDGDGEPEEYTLVGAIEAKPSANMISNESPLGKALSGRRAGETTYFFSPGGRQTVEIKSVR